MQRPNRMTLVLTFLFLLSGLHAAFAYTLSGTIYGGSNPLQGAAVTLTNASTSLLVGSSTTDVAGAYSFSVVNGTYNLSITSSFGTSLVNGVVVSGYNVTENVVLVQSAVTLSGVVHTSGGVGIKNVHVKVYGQTSNAQAGEVWTDANGNYSVSVPGSTYKIYLEGGAFYFDNCGTNGSYTQCTSNIPEPNYFYSTVYPVQNLVVSGNTTQDITIPLVTLSGKTTDTNSVPIGHVSLKGSGNTGSYDVISDNYSNSPPVRSDSSGNYSMPLISGSGYSITLIPPSGIPVAQTVVSGVNVTNDTARNFALQPAFILSGVVHTSGGVGIKNVHVKVYGQDE